MRLLAALVAPVVVAGGAVVWLGEDADPALRPVTGIARDLSALAAPDLVAGRLPTRDTQLSATLSRDHARGLASDLAQVDPLPDGLGPLGVTIDRLTPGVVPKRRPVTVSGTITNLTEDTWTGLNVYPCTSRSPMTTESELTAAAETPADAVVCQRTHVFDTIDELGPGASVDYRIRVARDDLGIGEAPGVYWFNVQVLGASPDGSDNISDGRARSFLPLVESEESTETSLVIPFRRSTLHDDEGALLDEDGWATDLGQGGRLDNLLDLAAGAPEGSVSLLVDPAVLVAVQQLAGGNQTRSLSPAQSNKTPEGDLAADADAWLARFRQVATAQNVLTLPYGDLDLAAAARHEPRTIDRAEAQSAAVSNQFRLAARPAVAPPSGLLSDAALELLDPQTVSLLGTRALPAAYDDDPAPPASVVIEGREVIIHAGAVAGGGPDTANRLGLLSLRQRLLSDAAVRAMSEDERPLVVVLPDDYDPGAVATDFWSGLERDFLDPGPMFTGGDQPEVTELFYPARQAERELGADVFAIGSRLAELGATLDRVLPENDTVGATATREALSAASYQVRDAEYETAQTADAMSTWYADRLAEIGVDAPKFVILSSEKGPFAVTITNGLDQPVRIGIRAQSDPGLEISAPEAIDVPAEAQRTVNLSAHATELGVHGVVLVVTDGDGRPINQTHEVSIRSNEVGQVIWVILGVGAGLLFGAIAVRLIRRIRRASA